MQRPCGRDLLGISRNIERASVAGLGKRRGRGSVQEAEPQTRESLSPLLLPSILAWAPGAGLGLLTGQERAWPGNPFTPTVC